MKSRTLVRGRISGTPGAPVWSEGPHERAGWASRGGAAEKHPDRANPTRMEVEVPESTGRLASVSMVGVFARHASADVEPTGTVGASLALFGDGGVAQTIELVNGFHYGDARSGASVYRLNGDGTSVETVGAVEIDGAFYRVDRLAFDVPGGVDANTLALIDSGTPASFVVFDVSFEFEDVAECPFKGHGGHVSLREVGAILRLRDRARLDQALHQMTDGIHACGQDLDEARGLALTFLAAVVGAMLELDPDRAMHKEQLEAARELEALDEPTLIAAAAVKRIHRLTSTLIRRASRTSDPLIDRALELMDRTYTKDLDADFVARELNVSTSHFRHLFREATRQPFQKYLVSLRLEKARSLLLQSDLPVTDVAEAVGFQSPAHFSRAFSRRFGVAPSALRQSRR